MFYAMMLLDEVKNRVNRLKKNEDGAALVEYTVLLGILLVAVIAIIAFVGTWISGQWSALEGQL
jgi:pilus assembly protein Flp/PilA